MSNMNKGGYNVAPRKFAAAEIDAVWEAARSFYEEAERPTFKQLTLRAWHKSPCVHGKLSVKDVWFICRDILRDKLGWVMWEREGSFGLWSHSSVFRPSTLGVKAFEKNIKASEKFAKWSTFGYGENAD